MTPEHWRQIEGLVESALERDGAQRRRFLDLACGGDADLRQAVDALLASFEEVETFLESPAVDHLDTSTLLQAWTKDAADSNHDKGARSGDRIGPYRIQRAIGRGGMGTVVLAAREDREFERRVAIKLIQPGMHSAGVARRFRSERQILANLDHPNIARLLDGGTTEDGRPYFVMELIEGTRIDEYCDSHRLTVRRRLELFREVCAAVHYAHRNLVVHRDIKPSNILVTDAGVPKLLDFGIAKLLDPADFPYPVEATRTGLRPMTPPYASPEQVRGQAITTASDVYSLGVLLYKLLTGRLPIAVEGLLPQEIETALVEEQPARPSTVLTQPRPAKDGDAVLPAAAVSRLRRAQPQQLRRQLAGDLDNIVLTALRKEPERRYGSVERLSEDLRRHLDGLPVSARRDTFGYRTGKFLRRNKLAAGIAGSSLALVLGFAATMTAQAIQLARQRDRARKEQEKAEKVAAFLTDLFEMADPDQARGDSVTAREILDDGAERIRRELREPSELQASLIHAVGKIYRKLGLHEQAEPLLEEALATREALLGADHVDVAASLVEVALNRGTRGRHESAIALFERALDIRSRALGHDHQDVGETLLGLAAFCRYHGDHERAEALYLAALENLEGALGPHSVELGRGMSSYASNCIERGQEKRAEELQQRALEILSATLPPNHPELATAAANLGGIYSVRGEFARAEETSRRALDIFEQTVGKDHHDVAICMLNLGICHSVHGEFEHAESLYRNAIRIAERSLGPHHRIVASGLYKLAIVHRRKGEYDRAEPLFLRALDLLENICKEDVYIAFNIHQLARLYRDRGELERAEPLYRRAAGIQERVMGHGSIDLAGCLQELAAVCAGRGRQDEAEALYERSAEIAERGIDKDPENLQARAWLASGLLGRGELDAARGRPDSARAAWLRACEVMEQVARRSRAVEHLDIYARALLHLDRAAQAAPLVERLRATGWHSPELAALCRRHGLAPDAEVTAPPASSPEPISAEASAGPRRDGSSRR